MNMIEYKPIDLNNEMIKHIYQVNGWTNYTNDMSTLIKGFKHSLFSFGAYEKTQLIGLVRVVGDGETIVYIQDILVDPSFHRQGVGKHLMEIVLKKYAHVRQIVLSTDNTKEQAAFYKAMGFTTYQTLDLKGFYYIRKR